MKNVRGTHIRATKKNRTKKLVSYYDNYVSIYNKRKDAISFLSDMSTTKKYLFEEYEHLLNYKNNILVKFIKDLDDLYKKPPSKNYIVDGKIANFSKIDPEKFEDNNRYYIKSQILEKITSNQVWKKDVRGMVKELYELCNVDYSLRPFTYPRRQIVTAHFRAEEFLINNHAIIQVMEKVVVKGYPEGLDKYNDLSEEEKEKIQKERNSNSDSLFKSSDWMDDAVKKIVRCETEEQILSYLRSIDNNFKKPNPNKGLFFKSGRLNLGAVGECLASIHNKRYPSDYVGGPAVKGRYNELSKEYLKKLENRK